MRSKRPSTFVLSPLTDVTKANLAVVLIFAFLPMTGCVGLEINHRPAGSTGPLTSVPGVPFYAKKARCRQEVVWFEPVYTLTLAAMLPGSDGTLQAHPRGVVVLSRTGFGKQDVTDFMKLLNSRPTDEGTVERAWQKVVALDDPRVLSQDFGSLQAADRILAGRSAAPVTFVDYSEQYYVNAKVPLAGSANLDAKVADDGSLSEASSQVQNQTLSTILAALPTSSVITAALGLGGKSIAGAATEIEAFQLTTSVSGYRHTLARLVNYPASTAACPVASDISLAEASEYKREDISTPSENTAPKNGGTDKTSGKDNTDGTASAKPEKKP